jgi:AcrR family transcriptional regulator
VTQKSQLAPRRGRPRLKIDMHDVADAVERLFAEGGLEAVSIERTAQELSVSRATLYRSVPSKEHLLGVLFERMYNELSDAARRVVEDERASPGERLFDLVRLQVHAAVRTRHYLFVFFGSGWLPGEIYADWRRWQREYEQLWHEAVTDAMEAGELARDDPVVTTRLILGMCIWVSRWYRPREGRDPAEIAEAAVRLVKGSGG